MIEYKAEQFISTINKQFDAENYVCPFCKGTEFITSDSYAVITTASNIPFVTLSPDIPAAMIICEKCGHIDFFSLRVLGLLKEGENTNGN